MLLTNLMLKWQIVDSVQIGDSIVVIIERVRGDIPNISYKSNIKTLPSEHIFSTS